MNIISLHIFGILVFLFCSSTWSDEASQRELLLLDKGDRAYNSQNYNEAVKHYTRLDYEFPENPAYMAKLALASLYVGKVDDAEAKANELLSLDSDSMEALNTLALVKRKKQDYQGAIDMYQSMLSIEPDNQVIKDNLADIYSQLGDDVSASQLRQ